MSFKVSSLAELSAIAAAAACGRGRFRAEHYLNEMHLPAQVASLIESYVLFSTEELEEFNYCYHYVCFGFIPQVPEELFEWVNEMQEFYAYLPNNEYRPFRHIRRFFDIIFRN
jgi:hypothetical protein